MFSYLACLFIIAEIIEHMTHQCHHIIEFMMAISDLHYGFIIFLRAHYVATVCEYSHCTLSGRCAHARGSQRLGVL